MGHKPTFWEILQIVAQIITSCGIVIGLPYGFWRYLLMRPYARRLNPSVTAEILEKDGAQYLFVTVRLSNVGSTKAAIEPKGTIIDVFSSEVPRILSGTRKLQWNILGTYRVLANHQIIESGESIEERQLIALPRGNYVAVLTRLCVVSGESMWKTESIVACNFQPNEERFAVP